MSDGSGNAYSQEYAIMTTNGSLVDIDVSTTATNYGGVPGHNITVLATKTGNDVDYKFTRTILQ